MYFDTQLLGVEQVVRIGERRRDHFAALAKSHHRGLQSLIRTRRQKHLVTIKAVTLYKQRHQVVFNFTRVVRGHRQDLGHLGQRLGAWAVGVFVEHQANLAGGYLYLA